ncbi:MAG: competence protein ComK [Erysipelotrichaceae bacterium]|nr:competence protein ComK [Erysipelotrichaceae bacterium]MDY5251307.1 competence protein ComK [Erysipelotrichaceae bacterium]
MMKVHANAMVIAMKNVAIVKFDKINQYTQVLTLDGQKQIYAQKPFKVISCWCLANGASIQGRMDAFKYALQTTQKSCILVNDHILLMPTTSINNEECVYINYFALFAYHQLDQHRTNLKLFNGQDVIVDFNYRIINKQYKRCQQYIAYLEKQRGNFLNGIFDHHNHHPDLR